MSVVRWILPLALLLNAACSCMETGTVGREDADQEELEAIDGRDAEDTDGSEYREVGREGDVLDETLPEAVTMPPACGDGVIDPGEECDDGNRRNGDGCDWMCRIGYDPFEYPPPDPDARPVEPTGPPEPAPRPEARPRKAASCFRSPFE